MLTFGDMTKEVNVFNLEQQPHELKDQTFKVNFIENNCEEESEGLENALPFLNELLKDEFDYINEKTYVEVPDFWVPFKKKFDLSVFNLNEPINDISHKNIIQESSINLTFENLFKEKLMCLEEPIKDILVNYTPPRKILIKVLRRCMELS